MKKLWDGGYRSRKMWMGAATAGAIFLGAVLSAEYPAFGTNYEVYVGGLVGTYVTYCGGNIGAKVATRGQQVTEPEEVKG